MTSDAPSPRAPFSPPHRLAGTGAPTPSVDPSFVLPLPARPDRSRRGSEAGARHLELTPGRPLVMGVVNLTPDSFSDGGRFLDPDAAIRHGLALVEAGADLLDLGAESTRPGGGVYGDGAATVPAAEEIDRLLPALEGLRAATDRPLSVDTRKAAVARAVLAAGADLVNDISALGDPEMGEVLAASSVPVVLMHARGELSSMQRGIHFDDVVAEVADELGAAQARAEAAGIETDRIVLDPGLGFGKTAEQNLELVRRLDELARLGRPLLVGASRKSFLGRLTGEPPERRQVESLAAAAWACRGGASILRVHDVDETVRFLTVWRALADATGSGPRSGAGEGA